MGKISAVTLAALALSAGVAQAQDADGDQVLDSGDARPCDPTVAAVAYAPAADDHGLLMFEDQFPFQGDLDFNDVVLGYRYRLELGPDGSAVRLVADLMPIALGGDYDSGLALGLPLPRAAATSVRLTVEGAGAVDLPVSSVDAQLTFDITADLRALAFPGRTGPVNVSGVAQPGVALEVVVTFAPGTQLDLQGAPFDLFVFRTLDRTHEIHQPAYAGSAQMNTALFGTGHDGSSPGRSFVDFAGLPFVLHLPTQASHPAEGEPVSALYPDVLLYAASGGTTHLDFYTSTVQSQHAYPTALPVRVVTPEIIDASCVVPGLEPGNPGTMCKDLLASGATADGQYWIDPDGPGGRDAFVAYCDMSTAGGGWTALIAPQDRSVAYLRRFDLSQDTLTGWSVNSSYGVSWGTYVSSSNWSTGAFRFTARVPFDEARITHSAWYNSPSGGLGNMHVSSNVGPILISNDAHTDYSRGQSLYVGEQTIYRLSTTNWANRTDTAQVPGSTTITTWMNAYTSSYSYTRRYISALWVR